MLSMPYFSVISWKRQPSDWDLSFIKISNILDKNGIQRNMYFPFILALGIARREHSWLGHLDTLYRSRDRMCHKLIAESLRIDFPFDLNEKPSYIPFQLEYVNRSHPFKLLTPDMKKEEK
jgi:hypothetical protein